MSDKLNSPPSETDHLEFFWIEYLLEELEEKIDTENKQYKKQEASQKKEMKMSQPKLGGFKIPKTPIPKY